VKADRPIPDLGEGEFRQNRTGATRNASGPDQITEFYVGRLKQLAHNGPAGVVPFGVTRPLKLPEQPLGLLRNFLRFPALFLGERKVANSTHCRAYDVDHKKPLDLLQLQLAAVDCSPLLSRVLEDRVSDFFRIARTDMQCLPEMR
jgi:hypothetical protein